MDSSSSSHKDLTVIGRENLPANEGFLILPNLLSYYDLLRLESLLKGKSVVYLIDEGAVFHPLLNTHIHRDGVDALAIGEATDAASYGSAVEGIVKEGSVVIYVPGAAAAIPAPLSTVPGLKLDFLLRARAPVLPLYLQRLKDTHVPVARSVGDGETVMAFGEVLRGESVTVPSYQESLLRLSEKAFSSQSFLDLHLGYALIMGLKKHGSRNVMIDGKDEGEVRFDKIFAAALALSRYIKKETNKKRVGIVLPPSPAGLIANIAVVLAGKTPVNLNFTAGRGAIESAIRQGDLDRFLTADAFVRKVQSFPWPPMKQLVMLERLMPSLKVSTIAWFFLSKLLPSALLATVLGLPKRGGNGEATVLFTSGSSGEPKGVVLTHRNLMANVCQFGSRLNMKSTDGILACLPLFHSFGCTVTLWYPVIFGLNLVSYPSPIEAKKLAELIQKYKVSVLLATPTFFRGYLRGVHREQLASLKLVVTGAEKLPKSVAEAFETRFGKRVMEGYGLTETSPVSNVNLNDPEGLVSEGDMLIVPGYRSGSVGQLMPGMTLRVTNTETGEAQPVHQAGIIWFKGANVFTGYLNDPKRSAEVLDSEGWFRTGDVGRLDLDGFLYIEGRISRFSKIAGEMVPHETVEEAINKCLGLESENVRKIAVVGVPDIEKGEALVLLTTLPGAPEQTEIIALRHRLIDNGVAPLWIPKKMIRITDIPILASGKLDIKACETIARAGTYG